MNRRRAFSLIELVVVLAIMAVLTGLLLAGVQRVRRAAVNAACQHKLRQVALGLHAMHDTNGQFPPGHRSYFHRDVMPYTGWPLSLLPYVEQAGLYDQSRQAFRTTVYPFDGPPHVGLGTVVPAYVCPADPRIQTAQVSHRTHKLAAFTSYLGVAGANYRSRDGILFQNSAVKMADVTDGLSCTLLLGERPPSPDFQFGWWYAGIGQRGTGSTDMTLGVREVNIQPITSGSPCGPGTYSFGESTFADPCGVFHFWSPHGGGANFALGDGSVRRIRYAGAGLLPALASRAGGDGGDLP